MSAQPQFNDALKSPRRQNLAQNMHPNKRCSRSLARPDRTTPEYHDVNDGVAVGRPRQFCVIEPIAFVGGMGGWCCRTWCAVVFVVVLVLRGTFRLDESLPTTTLLPSVPQSTRLLRRNHTTLTKYNLVSSITIRRHHRQIGHGDINKIIFQLRGDLLTPHLQRLPTKSRLRCGVRRSPRS